MTGSSIGYYVHKQVGQDAYVKEVTLSYEYSQEDSSKVEYIIYNDSITVNADEGGLNRLGVNRDTLNYTKASFDYTELFTKKEMRSEYLSVSWQKVDRATDMSFVEKQLGTLKKYDYKAFSVRGIYGISTLTNSNGVEPSEYQYFFYVIDTADGALRATAYYSLTSDPNDQKVREATITKISDDWSSISLDGEIWTADAFTKGYYNTQIDNVKHTLIQLSHDISYDTLDNFVKSILSVEQN